MLIDTNLWWPWHILFWRAKCTVLGDYVIQYFISYMHRCMVSIYQGYFTFSVHSHASLMQSQKFTLSALRGNVSIGHICKHRQLFNLCWLNMPVHICSNTENKITAENTMSTYVWAKTYLSTHCWFSSSTEAKAQPLPIVGQYLLTVTKLCAANDHQNELESAKPPFCLLPLHSWLLTWQ